MPHHSPQDRLGPVELVMRVCASQKDKPNAQLCAKFIKTAQIFTFNNQSISLPEFDEFGRDGEFVLHERFSFPFPNCVFVFKPLWKEDHLAAGIDLPGDYTLVTCVDSIDDNDCVNVVSFVTGGEYGDDNDGISYYEYEKSEGKWGSEPGGFRCLRNKIPHPTEGGARMWEYRYLAAGIGWLAHRGVSVIGPPANRERINRTRRRLGRPEFLAYHTVVLDREKMAYEDAGGGSGEALHLALHTVRSHPRHLRNGRVVQVRAHRRGDRKYGVIVKDYDVRSPPDGERPSAA